MEGQYEEGMKKGMEKGRKEGMEKGRKEEKLKIARKLHAKGMSKDEIAEMTGLSMNEVEGGLLGN